MSVRYEAVGADADGQRLDNFLLARAKGVPRSVIYRIVRTGQVRVNGKRAKVAQRLCSGDEVRIPPLQIAAQKSVTADTNVLHELRQTTLFEDDDYLLLNKPAGWAVHAGSGIRVGIVELLREGLSMPRLELVHRLDRGTSGLLLLAKNRPALNGAQGAWRTRTVKKIYTTLVWGRWDSRDRVVQHRLARYETAWGERRVRVDPEGRSARSDFAVQRIGRNLSWLRVRLHTGRTHQIRVHAQSCGCVVVGDDKYDRQRDHRAQLGLSDHVLCLHAARLQLHLPGVGEVKWEVPEPEHFQAVWAADGNDV
ncbi:MAG: RluA family pseudouridine synthase [Pseudomonadota bacterium]